MPKQVVMTKQQHALIAFLKWADIDKTELITKPLPTENDEAAIAAETRRTAFIQAWIAYNGAKDLDKPALLDPLLKSLHPTEAEQNSAKDHAVGAVGIFVIFTAMAGILQLLSGGLYFTIPLMSCLIAIVGSICLTLTVSNGLKAYAPDFWFEHANLLSTQTLAEKAAEILNVTLLEDDVDDLDELSDAEFNHATINRP